MEQSTLITMSAEDFRTIVREEVEKAVSVKAKDSVRELPPLLTRLEFMDLLHISSTKATELFGRPGFPIIRQGKILIDTELLFVWLRKNNGLEPEDTNRFSRSVS